MKCSKCNKVINEIFLVKGLNLCYSCYKKDKIDIKSKCRQYTRADTFKVGDIVTSKVNSIAAGLKYRIVKCNKTTCWVVVETADYKKLGNALLNNNLNCKWIELIEKLKKREGYKNQVYKNIKYLILKKVK